MQQLLRILLIGDNNEERKLAARMLRKEFRDVDIAEVSDAAGLEEAFEASGMDIVVTADELRWTRGVDVLRKARDRHPDVPVIMCAKVANGAVCAEAMKSGLSDYVVKEPGHYLRLPFAVRAALQDVKTREELRRSELENLRQRHELAQLLEREQKLNESLEQRVAERTAVAEKRSRQLASLATKLTLVEEQERLRLAQLLHDDLQQLLAAASLTLNNLEHAADGDGTQETVGEVRNLLDRSMNVSRSLTAELSPPILRDRGLGGALEWLVRQFRDKYSLRVEVSVNPGGEPTSEVPRIFLFQAARELLFNVVKHAGTDRAELRLEGDDGELRLTVADEGRGFDPPSMPEDVTESGFGLFSIAERSEVMGGRFQVEASPQIGTKITIILPREVSSEAEVEAPGALLKRDVFVPEAGPSGAEKDQRVRVLLADDHQLLRQGLARLLTETTDIDLVAEAADGQQAVDLALRTQPDVVLMDVTMPRLNGVEATRKIHSALPEVRVIGISMHHRIDMESAMREAGAAAYVVKDGPVEQLIDAIRRAAPSRAGGRP